MFSLYATDIASLEFAMRLRGACMRFVASTAKGSVRVYCTLSAAPCRTALRTPTPRGRTCDSRRVILIWCCRGRLPADARTIKLWTPVLCCTPYERADPIAGQRPQHDGEGPTLRRPSAALAAPLWPSASLARTVM